MCSRVSPDGPNFFYWGEQGGGGEKDILDIYLYIFYYIYIFFLLLYLFSFYFFFLGGGGGEGRLSRSWTNSGGHFYTF